MRAQKNAEQSNEAPGAKKRMFYRFRDMAIAMNLIILGKVAAKLVETALTAEGIKTKLAEIQFECNSSIPDSARIKRNLRELLPYYKVQR
jgi:hypothetical protein